MSCLSLSQIATLVSQLVSPFSYTSIRYLSHPSSSSATLTNHRLASWTMSSLVHVTYCLMFFYFFIFGYRVESPHSHGSTTFDIAHIGVWHYLLGDLGLCFPSFHSPFTPGLYYGPSGKTTLRPWDLVSALTRFIRTSFIYWLSMGFPQVSIASGDIEGHILPFHLVYLPQVRDQRWMIQRVGTVEGNFARCIDTFIRGHTPILAC